MDQPAALSIRDLLFRYRSHSAEDRFELSVGELTLLRGEQLLVRGGSGRGKSTLLQLIAGLMEPDGGTIHIHGQNLRTLHGAKRDRFRGRTIGMIFQTFNLLHGFTAAENVMAAMMFSSIPRSEHQPRAEALLRHLGIDAPGRDPQRMSVGQQQRVAVARAVACDPALVLADEPTASLDPTNAAIAVELIKSICDEKNAALLMVSHDPSMDEHFENAIALEGLCAPSTAEVAHGG